MGLNETVRWLLAEVVLIARPRYGRRRLRHARDARRPKGRQ